MKELQNSIKDIFHKGDMVLLSLCCICATFSVIMVASATRSFPGRSYVPVQIASAILGICLYGVFTVIDLDIIADKWPLLLAFETFLLLLLIPFGVEGDTGNSGWLRFAGIGIQPSEIVKVVFIILLAKHITYLRNTRTSAPSPPCC